MDNLEESFQASGETTEASCDPELRADAVFDVLVGRTKLKRMYEEARARYDANPMTEEDFAALEAIVPTEKNSH